MILFVLTISCRSSKYNESYGTVLEPLPKEIKDKIVILKLKKSIGVIFPKEYEGFKGYFSTGIYENRFTPNENEIRKMEFEIEKQYLDTERKWANYQAFNWPEDIYQTQEEKQIEYNNLMKYSKKEAKEIKYFDRQYIGYLVNGDKYIFIKFFDFRKDPYKLKNQLTESVIDGWHGWFTTNVRQKKYNLNKKILSN